ncbi:MAG: MATE family efflux transporter [Rhodobacteraceae bacterium]|nr:MATE family efflux transporter [Paracoccaceae bacterium]
MSNSVPISGLGKHIRASLVLGLPLIGSNLAQMAVNLTDTIMVGWYGIDELAAVTLATSIYFVFFIVGSGFAMAVMPMVASAEGANDKKQVRRVVRMGLWISVLYCAALMPILWNFESLMLMIGQEPKIAALAQDYMRIAQWGVFPAILIMVLKSYLSAVELPGWVLWATITGAVANALLNYALIFGNWGAPELGIRGAAIASILTQLVTFLVLVTYANFKPQLKDYTLFLRIWRPDWPAFREVARLGWPIGATMLAEVGLFSATAIMMGWIGTRELATHGIVIQISAMSFMFYLGLANVATIRVGRALGQKDLGGIHSAAAAVTMLQLGTATCVILVFVLFPQQLIGFFLDRENENAAAIIAYGSGLMMIAVLFQIVDGLQAIALSVLRGLKDTRVPMLCAVFSYWMVGMPSSYMLGFLFGFGGYGIWGGLVIGLAMAALTLIWRYRIMLRRLQIQL